MYLRLLFSEWAAIYQAKNETLNPKREKEGHVAGELVQHLFKHCGKMRWAL